MRDMLTAARARTGDWRYPHVGLLAWDFFMVVCHLSPAEHIRLWHDAAGALVAYAMLGDEQFDWQVLPEHRWSGIEEEALVWVEGLHAGLRRTDSGRWGGPLVAGGRPGDAARLAFLEGPGVR